MNPRLPYCAGHELYGKAKRPKNVATTNGASSVYLDPLQATAEDDAPPSVITTSAINWRFADPHADALASISFSRIAATPIELGVMAGLGSKLGLSADDMATVFDAFSEVDQVALSIRAGRILIMVTGCAPDAVIPALEANWKAEPIKNGMLIGPSNDVDQAILRIADDGALSELARLASTRQANGAFWATGSGDVAGAVAEGANVKRFTLTASMRNRLASDLAFEFQQPPDENALRALPVPLGGATTTGNSAHFKMSMEADEIEQNIDQIALTPLGKYVGALVAAGRYIPRHDPDAKPRVKPTIHGLDGNF